MKKEDFLKRTRAFGLRVIHLVETLPRTQTAQILRRQLLRAGTSGRKLSRRCPSEITRGLHIQEGNRRRGMRRSDLLDGNAGGCRFDQVRGSGRLSG